MINLAGLSVAIVDVDAGIAPSEIQTVAAALQRQALEHIGPYWGTLATVRAASKDEPLRASEVVVRLKKTPGPDQQDELGDHNETAAGLPFTDVFPILAQQLGASWSSVVSHELAELMADPFLNRCVVAPNGLIWVVEVADAVESFSYKIDGVDVSDFCTPAWFSPPSNDPSVLYDYMGKCTAPFQVLAGGYGQTFDPAKGWTQHGGARSAYRAKLSEMGLARGIRRVKATPGHTFGGLVSAA